MLQDSVLHHRVTRDQVAYLSQRTGKVALSLASPHAFLSIVQAMAPDLAARSPATVAHLNPIGISEYMSGGHDDVMLCPLIYGYVNYAAPSRAVPLAFSDAPRMATDLPPGSILGGTGIAISRRARVDDTLRQHLLWLMSPEAQKGFIPDHDGQPGTREAWADARVNRLTGNFFTDTEATLSAASIRPRHDGYIAFQTAASAALRDGFGAGLTPAALASRIEEMFHASHMKEPQP